jgi:UDP-2,3-diacylglucosamine pyrophosphatase LpxH
MAAKLRYRSVFLSDTHLGMRAARSEYLLDFLRNVDCGHLYLVGDIVDIWKLRSGWHWTRVQSDLVREVLRKAKNGTKVTYVPGNHDELFRDYPDFHFSGLEVKREAEHRTADGRRFLILHGDEFDAVVMNNKWLAHLGSGAYDFLLWLNRWYNVARRRLGFGYWSLSAFLKRQVKEAVAYIGSFEDAVVRAVREREMDGVICGHIHHAVITDYGGVVYANCGDWVESYTALVEEPNGALRLIHWAEESFELLGSEREAHAHCDTDGRLVTPG